MNGAVRGTGAARRLLLIGLDGAEPSRIEEWAGQGALVNLRRLMERGSYGPLSSSAALLAGSPWPTFYTGSSPAEHGLYHDAQWRADRTTVERPAAGWLPVLPFWRAFPEGGPRAVVLDVPMVYPPDPFPGVEISGWATHDHLGTSASHPRSALGMLRREAGRCPIAREVHGPQRAGELLALARDLARATRLVADAGAALMRHETWDLCLIALGAAHRGGHKLWDETCAKGAVSPGERDALRSALRDVYVALDAAVGSLVEAAGREATVLVFSVHGMGVNNSRVAVLPEMLRRVIARSAGAGAAPAGRRRLAAARDLVPLEFRRVVKRGLPVALQDRLTAFWAGQGERWETARAFCLPADQHGYVRINLKGREAKGVVPAGDRDALSEEIAAGLLTFRDARNGDAPIADVVRTDRFFQRGARSDLLPDLVVRWRETPAGAHEALASDRHGTIPWPTPGKSPGGRSGNHRGKGFVLAAGPGVPGAARLEGGSILDLAPTVCALLGVPAPFPMEGKPLRPIV